MKNTAIKTDRNRRWLSLLLAVLLFLSLFPVTVSAADEAGLITTEADLKEALHNANEGDTILVGDIEFAYSPMGMTLSKGVTIKSGKDTPAVFSGGAFAVMGGASEQDTISIRFENITFAGVNDIDSIDFTGKQIMTATKIRPAVFFSRCVNAAFLNCDFTGYSMANGGAIYGIYSSSDSTGYRLSVSLEDCSLNANAGGYGGAIYLSGAGNIFLDMKNCELSRNVAGYGGAIWADQATVTLENCKISGNRFENFYPDTLTKGGGIYVGRGMLSMKNCYVTENQARNGGGVALSYTESVIDGCVISGNSATENGGGIWNENYGNNLVTIVNGTIADNTAASGGALYISENEAKLGSGGVGKIFLVLSTLSGNTPAMQEYGEERLSMFGCALHGEGRGEAMPSEANQYNYFTETKHAGDPYEHLDGSVQIDGAVLAGVSGDRFDNRHGIFYAGNNAHSDTTYRFLVDGEVRNTVTVGYGEMPTLPEYSKDGYTFSKWQFDDGCDFDHSSVLFVGGGTGSVDLCALWIPNVYEVTFSFGEMQTKVPCAFGEAILFPEVMEKDGYTFVGWFTLPDGKGDQLAVDAAYSCVGETTYYAFYQLNAPVEQPMPTLHQILLVVLISIVVSALVAGVIRFFYSHKKKEEGLTPLTVEAAAAAAEAATSTQTPKIIKTRYTDEEIDRIVHGTLETHLLTDRELDIFREMLKGRKQGEIAYYLGITVHTVKDYVKRVYGKLGVTNRNELFEIIDSKLHRE